MKLNYLKVTAGLAILIVVVAGLWLYRRYESISASAFEARRLEITAHIQSRATALIKPEAFTDSDALLQRQVFERFFEAIQSPEIFRVKVFDRRPKIIWSNLKEIIGEDASNNREATEALNEGKITLKFKSLKPEQVSERQYREFTETYVPIRYAKGQIVGVIEVYQTALSAKKEIREELLRSAITTLAVALAVFIAAALILRLVMKKRRGAGD